MTTSPLLIGGYPAVSALVLLTAARRRGLDLRLGSGLTAEALERTLTIPWPVALELCDEVERTLDAAEQRAFIREFLAHHPLITAIAPFMAGPSAFLGTLWRGSFGVTMPLASSYEMSPEHHELTTSLDELGRDSRGLTHLTGLVAIYASEVVGAPPLEVLDWECTPRRLRVRLRAPLEVVSAERHTAASHASIGMILQSLQLLGPVAREAFDEGSLLLPGREATVHEALQLGAEWSLTPTEARVSLALGEGRSPREIAEELSVSVDTVRVHLKHVYAKTETANQRELAARVTSWRSGD